MATKRTATKDTRGRRPNNDGAIYQATNGSGKTVWMGEIRLDGKRRRVTGKTESEVATKLRQLREDFDNPDAVGVAAKTEAVTVGDVLRDWIDDGVHTRTMTSSTRANHSWAVDRLLEAVCPSIGKGKSAVFLRDIEVDALSPALVQHALRWMMNNPKPKTPGGEPPKERLSVDALKRLRNILAMAVDYAILMDRATLNRVRLAPIPKEATPDGRRGFIPYEDVIRLLPALREDDGGAIIYLMIRTGLRFEEAAAMTVDSYNGATINIWKTVRKEFETTDSPRVPGQKFRSRLEVVDQLKTKTSRRTVALPADVVEVLDAHLVRESARIKAASDSGGSPLLFARPNGAPLSNGFVNKRLKAICDGLGVEAINGYDSKGKAIPAAVSCHVLRHTMTTLTIDRGVVYQDLADALGQRDTRMIHNRYKHTDPNQARTAAVENDWLVTK